MKNFFFLFQFIISYIIVQQVHESYGNNQTQNTFNIISTNNIDQNLTHYYDYSKLQYSKIKLKNGVNLEFSKDLAQILIESNLGSNCETIVFVVSPVCEKYLGFICFSLSFWGPPIIVTNYEQTFKDLSEEKQRKWRQMSSSFQQPCKIIFICAMIQHQLVDEEEEEEEGHSIEDGVPNVTLMLNPNSTTNSTEILATTTTIPSLLQNETMAELPKFTFEEGFLTFPKFIQYNDQVLYFTNLYNNFSKVTNPQNNTEDDGNYVEDMKRLEESENKVMNKTGILLSIQLKNQSKNAESIFHVRARCRYCGSYEKNKSLGNWKRNRTSFSIYFKAFEDEKRLSFQNYHSFIIGYWNYFPHIQCKTNTNLENQLNCTGAEYNMLSSMSGALNFTFILKNFTNNGQQGNIYSEKNITGIIGAIKNEHIDFGVGGITISYEKLSFLDFTYPFTNQPIVFVVEKRNDLYLLGILLAFNAKVWPLIIFTILCVALTIKLILKHSIINKFKSNMKTNKKMRSLTAFIEASKRKISTFQGLEMTIQPLLSQPLSKSQIPRNPRRILKLVLCLWWFASVIISTVYSTNLITSLINPVSPKEPESLQELLDFNYRFSLQQQAVFDLIERGGEGDEYSPYSQIKSRLDDSTTVHSSHSKIAYALEESSVSVVEWKKKYGLEKIRVIKERLFLASFAWPVKKFSPYKNKLNAAMSAYRAGGVISFWYRKFTHKDKKPQGPRFRLREKLGQVKLNLELLQGAFLFLLFGCIASFLVFIWHHIMFRYTFRFFTRQEIQNFCKMLIRKFQEMENIRVQNELTRAGIIVVAPSGLETLISHNRRHNTFL